MRDQEIIGLMEAYSSIYTQPQELTEEVEIAAQYFYEMGLNEDGVNILIDELGVEEFGEFVYEIAEEYTLTEATRLQSGGAKLKGPKGSKPQSVTVRREKKQGGTTMKADAAPASTISPKKVAAAKKAKEKQPERKGILGRISQEVEKGMARHKAAMSAARETGKTIRKAAGHIGGVAREVGKGATGAAKFAGAVAKEVTKEEADLFDIVLEHLVAEGYADTNAAALAIMANMSEEWKQSIVEETLDEAITSEKGKAKAAAMIAARSTPSGRAKAGKGENVAQIKHIVRSEREGLRGTPMTPTMAKNPAKSRTFSGTGNKAARRAGTYKD